MERKSFSPNPGRANGTVPSRDSDFWSDSEMFSPTVSAVALEWCARGCFSMEASRDLYSMRGICVTVAKPRKHECGAEECRERFHVFPPHPHLFLSPQSATCLTISTGISLGGSFGFVSRPFFFPKNLFNPKSSTSAESYVMYRVKKKIFPPSRGSTKNDLLYYNVTFVWTLVKTLVRKHFATSHALLRWFWSHFTILVPAIFFLYLICLSCYIHISKYLEEIKYSSLFFPIFQNTIYSWGMIYVISAIIILKFRTAVIEWISKNPNACDRTHISIQFAPRSRFYPRKIKWWKSSAERIIRAYSNVRHASTWRGSMKSRREARKKFIPE